MADESRAQFRGRVSRRQILRAGLGAAAGATLATVLGACGGGATPGASGGAGGAATAAAPAGTAVASAAAAGAAPGSTVAALGTPVGVNASKPPRNPNALKLQFWYGLGGSLGAAVAQLADGYNESQSDVYIEAIYQGNYDDTLNKFKAGLPAKTGPHIMQVYDIGLRYMIDSKAVEPMQGFIDAAKFDTSTIEPAILNYYTVDKQLYSMPFNTSNPLLYYNKKLFAEAGLDPNTPPRTWDEVQTVAERLTKRDGAGKVTQSGIAIGIDGWFFEQFHATQNALYANPDNGRGGGRATKVVYNEEPGVKILDWWKGMVDKGVAANLGRGTSETQKAFLAGQAAMTLSSTASLRSMVSGAGDKFEVGTGYMPRPSASGGGGIIMGGASAYILKDKPDREKQAAWGFVQWLAQPKQQASWHINTGYFPVRKEAYDLPEVGENTKKFPQFETAVKQIRETPLTPATSGAMLGIFTQARQSVEGAIEESLLGRATPKAALDRSAADINRALELYNASVR